MRYHRHAASLGLTLTLALQMRITSGQHEPVVVGETENGTRYYVEPWPPCMRRNRDGIRRHTVNDIECMFMRPYLERNEAKGKAEWQKGWQWWVYVVDDVRGSKQYMIPERRGELPGGLFPPNSGSGFAWSPILQTIDQKLVTDLIKRDRMFVTQNADKPAPNGIYYGFNEEGLQAIVQFDKTSQVKQVSVNWKSCGLFHYTMLGKAVVGFFSDPKSTFGLILEPVDREKFDGSRESFSRARINTIEGWKGDKAAVYEALGSPSFKPLEAVSKVFRTLRNSASRFRRRGKDGLKDQLLTKDDTEEGSSDDDACRAAAKKKE
ncbi:hypothetical protein FOZ62_005247 [Perkinsus olseni]|uniref:Uncharacterized protein n=1 Tax=Perkinsus olseni TaxID=32597 RepID=A0A7J6UHY6_PEROL|nr:hypothetical protein FOZ62_005247 [Perkinsus olseni]